MWGGEAGWEKCHLKFPCPSPTPTPTPTPSSALLAGKTTLLDVLARKKTGGHVHGTVKINGVEQDDTFKRLSGYVEQQDIHTPRASIREAMMFSAALRLPLDATLEDRKQAVRETAALLGLTEVLDVVIGESGGSNAIPLEMRKRVTIAVELVSNPSILFSDEPTSGLDTLGALVAIKALRKVANSGRSVIVTVHQPSAEIFELFDYLLLMQRGGRTAYFGPLGHKSATMLDYFVRQGSRPCGEYENPADYMLIMIGAGIAKTTDKDWAALWQETPERQELLATVESLSFVPRGVRPFSFEDDVAHDSTTQFFVLLVRSLRTYWRTPSYNLVRQVFAVAVSLLLGLSYFDLDNDQAGLRGRVAVLYFSSVLGVVAILNAMPPMFQDRAVFYRERSSGYYRSWAYFMATGLVELPFVTVMALLYSSIFYWLVGLKSSGFGFFFLVYWTFNVSLGWVEGESFVLCNTRLYFRRNAAVCCELRTGRSYALAHAHVCPDGGARAHLHSRSLLRLPHHQRQHPAVLYLAPLRLGNAGYRGRA